MGEKEGKRKSGGGSARMGERKGKARKEGEGRKERTGERGDEEEVGARTVRQTSQTDELVRTSEAT